MSHAEAFGQLRSFVVGLEIKAGDLRKVLETSREDGKWVNGKDGTGVGERCARAIGAARPEQVTQEMVAEVAEQDKLLRQAEGIVRTEKPIEEATEKYQALVEYNQLALEDLEERLSAYGYVRPARVPLDNRKADDQARPPVVSSLPARAAAKTCGRSTAQDSGHPKSEAKSSGGGGVVNAGCSGAAGGSEEAEHAHDDSSFGQEQMRGEGGDGGSNGLGACGSSAAIAMRTSDCAAGCDAGGGRDNNQWVGDNDQGDNERVGTTTTARRRGMEGEEEVVVSVGGWDAGVVAATPARPALGVREEQEEELGSPPTPESPGLADWEITEGAREMLRRAQPHQEQQHQSSSSDSISSITAPTAPRSLEALLTENAALSATDAYPGNSGGRRNRRRSSVSSDWSPPPSSTTGIEQSSRSSVGNRRHRGFGDDSGDYAGRGSAADGRASSVECGEAEIAVKAAAAEMVVAAGGGRGRVEASPLGSSSNPPTPARMDFEGEEEAPLTPAGGGEGSVAIGNGTGDRTSSVRTPRLGSRSPLESDATASLVETALSCERRPDASTPSDKAGNPATWTTKASGANPPIGGGLTGPQGDFWGAGSSPDSSVVAASGETTREIPAPMSPETPATPAMLSPRFRTQSAERGGASISGSIDTGGNAAGDTDTDPSDSVTQSVNRRLLQLTPVATESGDICAGTTNSGNGGGDSNVSANSDGDGYDSDKCPTPELSSPLRSSNISVRDLEVLTPSAKINNGGCSSSSRDSANNRGDSDELYDSDQCPTPELSSPLRSTELSAGSAALCRRRLDEASGGGGPLELVSEEEYARAPKFLTIQVSRSLLNETIENLNAYAAPRLASPSELLLTVEEIMDIIDRGDLSRTLLLSAAHLKRIEMKGSRMYRIRA